MATDSYQQKRRRRAAEKSQEHAIGGKTSQRRPKVRTRHGEGGALGFGMKFKHLGPDSP